MRKKSNVFISFILITISISFSIFGCNGVIKNNDILKVYEVDNTTDNNTYSLFTSSTLHEIKGFGENMAVIPADFTNPEGVECTANSVLLFCLDDNEVLYAQNAHEIMNPASITKLMTAYLTLKYGNLNDIVTITEASSITEYGATVLGLKPGDKISLYDLLACSLIYSANDAAAAIAIHISGSIEAFSKLMTDEAHALGATNTTFKNPHGLTEEGHLTTAYDTYIILKKCCENETFMSITNQPEYSCTYTLADGTSKTKKVQHTLRYHVGKAELTEGVTLLGGKTGTTNAAGHCLSLIIQNNTTEKKYIAVLLKAYTRDILYTEAGHLQELCANDE